MRPCWLGRAVRNRHHHAIEQASRRWRGGRRDESARTRRKTLIYTQVAAAQGAPSVPLLVFGALAVAAAGVAVSKFAALTGEVAV